MAIIVNEPITIPAVPAIPEQIADQAWISELHISAPEADKPIIVMIRVSPYVSSTQTILKDKSRVISITDLYSILPDNPDLATAVGAIYQAVQSLLPDTDTFNPTPIILPTQSVDI